MADLDAIKRELEKSLQDKPENVDARIELANNYIMRGDYYNAAAELQKVVKIAPPQKTYIEAYYQLGVILRTMGNFSEAKKCMEKVLEVEEDNGNALYYAGLIYSEMGDYRKASEALRKSIAILSPQAYLHYALGNAELQLGNLDSAIIEFKKALEFAPKDIQVRNTLGLTYLLKGAYKEALKELADSLQINPKDPTGIFLYTWASVKQEKEVEALEIIEKFVADNSTHSLAHLTKSALHYLMGEFQEGKESQKKGLELLQPSKDPVIYSTFQVVLSSLSDISEEKQILEEDEIELKKNLALAFQEVIGIKDKLLKEKSLMISHLALAMARASGEFEEGEIIDIGIAGTLCNLGMALMPDIIVSKEEKLTDEEKKILATHPLVTVKVIERIKALSHILPFIKHHHERWNGTGYPDRLKEDDIPFEASILGIADFFTELTLGSKRQRPASRHEAINAINTLKNNFFSKKVIDLFNNAVSLETSFKE